MVGISPIKVFKIIHCYRVVKRTELERQTETDRDKQRQTETDRDRQRQTERIWIFNIGNDKKREERKKGRKIKN